MAFPLCILCLDFFGVTVALPEIGEDLNASTGQLEWSVNAYLLAFAAPLIALGRLADIVGRRKIVLLGTGLFAAASAVCGFAQSIEMLIAARVVQGIGASMLYSTSLSIVSNAFTEEKRGTGIGVWTGVGTIGQTAGPLLAGVLTTYLSWRWFFMVNIPLAIAGIALIVPILAAAVLNLGAFDFAGRPLGIVYLAAYVVVLVPSIVYLVRHREALETF